jgi:hypothetical protein
MCEFFSEFFVTINFLCTHVHSIQAKWYLKEFRARATHFRF